MKNIKIIVVFALATILTMQLCVFKRNAVSFSEEYYPVKHGDKKIYLTFDDGPSASVTPKVQQILKKHDVRATFFVVVSQAEKHSDIIKSLYRQGHTIAVHCYNHDYSEIYKSAASFEQDLRRAVSGLKAIIPNMQCNLMRFPGGSFSLSQKYIDVVQRMGMRYVDWNATNGDTLKDIDSAYSSFEYAVSTSAGRDRVVMLMHDNKTLTLSSLDMIIMHFKQEGYTFCVY